MTSAGPRPIRRGKVQVNPKPGWKPSFTKLAVNRASGEAMRISATIASPNPAPTAAPCIAATMGNSVENSLTA